MYFQIYLVGLLKWWLFITSLVSFSLMAWDKWQAKRGGWRQSEKRLLKWTVAGGFIGTGLGMFLCFHKTTKFKFWIVTALSAFFWIYLLHRCSTLYFWIDWSLWLIVWLCHNCIVLSKFLSLRLHDRLLFTDPRGSIPLRRTHPKLFSIICFGFFLVFDSLLLFFLSVVFSFFFDRAIMLIWVCKINKLLFFVSAFILTTTLLFLFRGSLLLFLFSLLLPSTSSSRTYFWAFLLWITITATQ